jgi:prephenate dehydrogenase
MTSPRNSPAGAQRRAAIIGTGLIGGSIGMALRRQGWWVTGTDRDPSRAQRALELGAIDEVGSTGELGATGEGGAIGELGATGEGGAIGEGDAIGKGGAIGEGGKGGVATGGVGMAAAVTFIAVPAGAVAEVAKAVLSQQDADGHAGVVTDVAGIKETIVAAVGHPRFVGGHPMAGSEQEGVDGAGPDLFLGATWVLTPGQHTSGEAYSEVQALVRLLGANPVAVDPRRHDELVALVSHTPHLTAAALMNLAADAATSDATLLRLAAGGFRDMTRIAAGHPGIWPDVVAENRDAICSALDQLSASLDKVRAIVAGGDRDGLLELLQRAREARVNLPSGAPSLGQASEVRVPVPDRPGVIAEVSTLLGGLGVNIFDVEIAHSVEGDRGVLVLIVDAGSEDMVRKALIERGYKASVQRLEP